MDRWAMELVALLLLEYCKDQLFMMNIMIFSFSHRLLCAWGVVWTRNKNNDANTKKQHKNSSQSSSFVILVRLDFFFDEGVVGRVAPSCCKKSCRILKLFPGALNRKCGFGCTTAFAYCIATIIHMGCNWRVLCCFVACHLSVARRCHVPNTWSRRESNLPTTFVCVAWVLKHSCRASDSKCIARLRCMAWVHYGPNRTKPPSR